MIIQQIDKIISKFKNNKKKFKQVKYHDNNI